MGTDAKPKTMGEWVLGKQLGRGGNGNVFRADKDGVAGAIKVLKHKSPNRVARFKDEVKAMRDCADLPGVLKVIDADTSPSDGAPPWFVMQLAEPMKDKLADARLELTVEAIAALASTLSLMHARGIAHRDVKPENLFYHEGTWKVGDLGLAAFDGKDARTKKGERIGPLLYIAPEMLNAAQDSDGRAADVYSLAKTLWVLATGQNFALPGTYVQAIPAFRIASYVEQARTAVLDALIAAATTFDPTGRPTMNEFAKELAAWLAPRPQRSSDDFVVSVGEYAIELEKRRVQHELKQGENESGNALRRDVSKRIGDLVRPSVEEVGEALKVDFVPVRWWEQEHMFELVAGIPGPVDQAGTLQISVSLDATMLPRVKITSRVKLVQLAPAASHFLLADSAVEFIEGGSEEDIQLASFREHLQQGVMDAVQEALELTIGRNQHLHESRSIAFTVRNSDEIPVQGAQVVLVGADGAHLIGLTDSDGKVDLAPQTAEGAVAFVAHPYFVGMTVSKVGHETLIHLNQSDGIGSMVSTGAHSPIPGLKGSINLIHDAQRRTYMYARNVAIDGGKQQPVDVSLGYWNNLRGVDGAAVKIAPKAVRGTCFLLDVASR